MKKPFLFALAAIVIFSFLAVPTEGQQAGKAKNNSIEKRPTWLLEKLKSGDVWVRVMAARELSNVKAEEVVNALSAALEDKSTDVRVEACRSLEKLRDSRVYDKLLALSLGDDMHSVRFYALRAACVIGGIDKAGDFLKKGIDSKDVNKRRAAVEGIGWLAMNYKYIDRSALSKMVALYDVEKEKKVVAELETAIKNFSAEELPHSKVAWKEWWGKNKDKYGEFTATPVQTMKIDSKIDQISIYYMVKNSDMGRLAVLEVNPADPVLAQLQTDLAMLEEQQKKYEGMKKDAAGKPDKAVEGKKASEIDATLKDIDVKLKDLNVKIGKANDEAATAIPAAYFMNRSADGKTVSNDKNDIKPGIAKAIDNSLNWLMRHQEKNGRWDCDDYPKNCKEANKDDVASIKQNQYDIAMTGLALLAFLGAGHTHEPNGNKDSGLPNGGVFKPCISKGLEWLMSIQKKNGAFQDVEGKTTPSMFEQGIATLALCEAYGMTKDPVLKDPAQRAIDFIVSAQSTGLAWRYTPNSDNDTSVTGWQVFALKSASVSGLNVPSSAFVGASNWLDLVSLDTGWVGYKEGGHYNATMAAVGASCRYLLGWRADALPIQKSVRIVAEDKSWKDKGLNNYHLYQAALALYFSGGKNWDDWYEGTSAYLSSIQTTAGCEHGSWNPAYDVHYKSRVYTTAIATLTLEVPYRYLPFAR